MCCRTGSATARPCQKAPPCDRGEGCDRGWIKVSVALSLSSVPSILCILCANVLLCVDAASLHLVVACYASLSTRTAQLTRCNGALTCLPVLNIVVLPDQWRMAIQVRPTPWLRLAHVVYQSRLLPQRLCRVWPRQRGRRSTVQVNTTTLEFDRVSGMWASLRL